MEFQINHGQKFDSLFRGSIELYPNQGLYIYLHRMIKIYLLLFQDVSTKGTNVSLLISNPLSGRNVGSTFTWKVW